MIFLQVPHLWIFILPYITFKAKANYVLEKKYLGADNYWPLSTITDNGQLTDFVFGNNGAVQGDGVNDDHGVLSLTGKGYVAFNGFAKDCLMDPSKCTYGFTVAFWMKLGGLISHIIGFNEKYHTALDGWLAPHVTNKSRWVMCYKASKHGWKGKTFRQNCASKKSTLTVIKVRNYIFGGFLSVPWNPQEKEKSSGLNYTDDEQAFLFSLNNPLGSEPFKLPIKSNMSSKAARASSTSMPSFGVGDLVLVDDANTSTQSTTFPGNIYQIPSGITTNYSQNLLAGSSPFLVDEIEVFSNEVINSERDYILTSGAEDDSSTGFSIYREHSGYLLAKVTANNKTWEVRKTPLKAWHHVAVTWSLSSGLRLLFNGDQVGFASTPKDKISAVRSEKTSLLLGGSSTTSEISNVQNIQMYGLAIEREREYIAKIRQYKNNAFSYLVDEGNAKFNWSSASCCTPTSNTGPSSSYVSTTNYISITNSYADVSLNIENFQMFTVCWSQYRTHYYPNLWSTVFVIKDSNTVLLRTAISLEKDSSSLLLESSYLKAKVSTNTYHRFHIWVHYCTRVDKNAIDIFQNGVNIRKVPVDFSPLVSKYNNIQVWIGNDFYKRSPFKGRLSDVNVWGRLLSSKEISTLYSKYYFLSGDVIRWSDVMSKFAADTKKPRYYTKTKWMYIESSYPRVRNDIARVITTGYIPTHINCLRFSYCLRGKDIGRFNVYLITNDKEKTLLWSLAGNQVNCGSTVYLPFKVTEKSKVVFEGIVGDGYFGDIAFRGVYFKIQDPCQGGAGKHYTPVHAIRSRIIGHVDSYTSTLQKWLIDAKLNQSYWTHCFNLGLNGWISSEELHRQCANKGPSVLLVRYRDYVFGGVFDQSWLEYSQCTSMIALPSDRSFLFSLKSDAGSEIVLPIRPDLHNQSFICSDSSQYFPNFGNDLVLDLASKAVKATYGTTYGQEAGRFVLNDTSWKVSDIEVLVPQVGFCPSICPLGTICDEIQGICVCDVSSRLSEVCQTGIFVENFTSDAHDLFTYFSPTDIKNHKRPVWGQVQGDVKLTKGITGNTVSTSRDSYVIIKSIHRCLTNPSQCSTGVTMSIWLKYFVESSWKAQEFLFCSDSCLQKLTGISISRMPSDNEVLNISLTTESEKCMYAIPGGVGVWTHLVLAMSKDNTLEIYKNGLLTPPNSETCVKGQYSNNADNNVVIGKGAMVDMDMLIVWEKVLSSETIEDLHNVYRGRKNMTLHFVYTMSSSLTNDKESREYQNHCTHVKTSINSIIPSDATAPIHMDCSSSTKEGTTVVSLQIVYNESGYDQVKPLIDNLKTVVALGGKTVQNVKTLELDTVFTQGCNITYHEVVGNNVSLEWGDCGTEPPYGLLYGYQINATDPMTNEVITLIHTSTSNLKTNFTKLKYATNYSFAVTTLTFEGAGKTNLLYLTTDDKILDFAPWNITAVVLDHYSINTTWDFFSLSEWTSIRGFTISYNSTSCANTTDVEPTMRYHILIDLKPLTNYTISIKGYNFASEGPFGHIIYVMTTALPLSEAPDNVKAIAVNYSTITVQWTRIPFNGLYGPILGYHVNLTIDNTTVQFLNQSEPTANIMGLSHSIEYGVEVRGYTDTGPGPWSIKKIVLTPEGVPSVKPSNLVSTLLSKTAFNLSWDAIDSLHAHGIVRGYRVSLFNVTISEKPEIMITSTKTTATLTNLFPFTNYHVYVAAFTSIGPGPNGYIYVRNEEKAPSLPPTWVGTAGQVGLTSMNITWDALPSESSFSPVLGYAVMYLQYPNNETNTTVRINDSSIMYQWIDGLIPYTTYDVRVAGINRKGVGVFSSQFIVQTAEEVPNVPVSNASAGTITKNSSVVKWNPVLPSDVRGVLQGYMISVQDTLRKENFNNFVCINQTSLILQDLFSYTSYTVSVKAFTRAGFGNATILHFQTSESAPDAPPQNVTSHNTSSSGLIITWQPPPITHINGKLRGYVVIWFETQAVNPVIFNKTLSVINSERRRKRRNVDSASSSQTFQIEGLKKFTMYTIRIQAFTVENGVFFKTNATTAEDVPSAPPPNITVHNSSSTTLDVAWQPIPETFRHGIFRGYQVFYQRSDKPSLTPMVETIDQSTLNVTLRNLSKFTTYDVSVAGFTTPGTGNLSQIFKVTTDEDVPGEAPLLAGSGLSTSEVSLSWAPIALEKQHGVIIGYNLSINHMNGSLQQSLFVNNGSALDAIVGGLVAWTNYTVIISGMTVKGSGPWSSKVLVTTLEEAPLPPTNLTATTLSSTSINVTWEASNTTFLRGILRNYRVIITSQGSVFPTMNYSVTTPATTRSVVVEGLYKYTQFEVVMVAVTIIDGNRSLPVIVMTNSDIPSGGPSGLTVIEATPYNFLITLGPVPPQDRNGVLAIGYKVVVVQTTSSSLVSEEVIALSANLVVVQNLKPFTYYTINISASTDKGWGVPSSITLQTKEAAPDGKPEKPAIPSHFAVDSIYVNWAPVSEALANGVVLGYRVTYQLISLGEEPIEEAPVNELTLRSTEVTLKHLEIYGRYKIGVSAFTEKGHGPENVMYGETCRCHRTLYANWREYEPYVNVSNTTGGPGGILPQVIKTMTEECCGRCSSYNKSVVNFFTNPDGSPAIKVNEDDLKTNISDDIDFTFPIYGSMDQKAYPGGFGYRALIGSPGIVLVLNKDFEFEYENPDGPSRTTIKSILHTLVYIIVTMCIAYLAGFVMWLLERDDNKELFPPSYIQGTYESFWWSFITMTTLGYGDRYPITFKGKLFAIVWMLTGIIITLMLLSFLSNFLTTKTISYSGDVATKPIAAIHNSPEFLLGKRLNANINQDFKPKSFQELYDILIQRKVYGAFIDGYAIGNHRDLFEHPSLKLSKIYDVKPAYGIVLAGNSSRLRRCFYRYIQGRRAEIFRRVAGIVQIIENHDEIPQIVHYSINLISSTTILFKNTVITLAVSLVILIIAGCVYEYYKDKSSQQLECKLRDIQELRHYVENFVKNMSDIEKHLRQKHVREIQEYLKREKQSKHSLKKLFTVK